MKKIYFSILGMAVGFGLNAQVAVTFSVDMTGQTVSPNGVHMAGAFNDPDQDGPLFPANYNADYPNWSPSVIELTDMDMDGVYAVTLNLNPARYEFKFINGNDWPQEESIPATCQVGGGNSNREIYVGDAATDYSICWNSCAPCGLQAVRFRVDMTTQPAVSPNGVHVAGAFQNPQWQAGDSPLRDNDGNGIWEGFYVVSNPTFEYKFINDNSWDNGLDEFVSGSCTLDNGSGNRIITLTDANTVLPVVCFESCTPCVEPSLVTFKVNLTNSCINTSEGVNLMGTATDWASGTPMTDTDLDGIWELTVPLAPGSYAYKFRVGGGNWEGFPGDRALTVVAGQDAVLDAVCWGLSTPCGPFNAPADVTFKVYPGVDAVPSGQFVWVMGDFTNPTWQGGAVQMTDANSDGIYEYTISDFCPQFLNYKFVIGLDNTNQAENWTEETADFTEIGGCGVDNGDFSDNRFHLRENSEPVELSYTFNTCLPAIVSVEENQMISSLNVYPVPATDIINVSFNSSIAQNVSVRILNNLGQVVVNQSVGTVSGTRLITMDVAQLASGLYTLELVGNSGKTSKLVTIK